MKQLLILLMLIAGIAQAQNVVPTLLGGQVASTVIVDDSTAGGKLATVKWQDPLKGSDSNPGTFNAPFKTISYGMTRLNYNMDTLVCKAGTNVEQVRAYGYTGIRTAPKVVMAFPGAEVKITGGGTIPSNEYSGLIILDGDYWVLKGLHVRASHGTGILMMGKGNIVQQCRVDSCYQTGIGAGGDSSIVEDCRVDSTCLVNWHGQSNHGWGAGITACRGGNGADDTTDYAIIRRDTVSETWGEGISQFEASHGIIEDCVIYNIYSAFLYISDAKYITARRNLIYATRVMENGVHAGYNDRGILIGDERFAPYSMCDTVYQNIVMNCGAALRAYNGINCYIANNTFVNGSVDGTVQLNTNSLGGPAISGWQFINNIVMQDSARPALDNNVGSGVTFSHNLVENRANYVPGAGDIIDTAWFKRTGTWGAGTLTRAWFDQDATNSPAIDAGITTVLNLPYNGSAPDIGARESGYRGVGIMGRNQQE